MPKKKKPEYEFKLTLKKGLIQMVYVVLAGLASLYGNNPCYLALAPLLTMIENYLKHRKK